MHAPQGIIRKGRKKEKKRNVQAQCVEVHRGSINIEETGWNQNTEGPYYEEMLGESISSKRPRARGMMAESR